MSVLPACVSVCHVCPVPENARRGHHNPGTGVIGAVGHPLGAGNQIQVQCRQDH